MINPSGTFFKDPDQIDSAKQSIIIHHGKNAGWRGNSESCKLKDMKIFSLITLCFFYYSNIAKAAPSPLKLKTWKSDKEVEVLIVEIKVSSKSFLVNESCAHNQKSCLALKLLKSPPKKFQHPKGLAGHPASLFCEAMGGTDVILSDEKMEQYNYCLFTDQTMIDSWQFYGHFFKNKKGDKK